MSFELPIEKKMDYHSNVNQKIVGKLVDREVIRCMSWEIEKLLEINAKLFEADLPSYDDIAQVYQYVCPDCGHGVQELDEVKNTVVSEDDIEEDVFICPYCKHVAEDEWDNEPQEIFEWWLVSEWFADKLKKHGEPILEWGNGTYWGRTCTGQALQLDYVMCRIAEDMEILAGQKNSWEDR
jgi:DNA-directed RNA polymerase subunit RPC12/RpoP